METFIKSPEVVLLRNPWMQLQHDQVFRVVEVTPSEVSIQFLGEASDLDLRDNIGSIEVKGITIDFDKRQCYRDGESCKLTRTEWKLLLCLWYRRNAVADYNYILRSLWGGQQSHDIQELRVWASRVRHKLGMGFVATVAGEGYAIFA